MHVVQRLSARASRNEKRSLQAIIGEKGASPHTLTQRNRVAESSLEAAERVLSTTKLRVVFNDTAEGVLSTTQAPTHAE